MKNLVQQTKGNKSWILKILCALHLLRQYRAISKLQPGHFGTGAKVLRAKKEFERRERYFVDLTRIMLYNICTAPYQEASKLVQESLGSNSNFKRMETAFLTLIVEKGSQEALVDALKEKANPGKKTFIFLKCRIVAEYYSKIYLN